MKKKKSMNRTLTLDKAEQKRLSKRLIKLKKAADLKSVRNRIICQDMLDAASKLPAESVDLLLADPPYNINKSFNKSSFSRRSQEAYEDLMEEWIEALKPLLKENASVYICGDWRSSTAIHRVLERHFFVQNRISWEREKGRGALRNWKNSSEDIWFATCKRKGYTFNGDDVMLKRKVIAPYRVNGKPKDWKEEKDGNFRLTRASNLWTDLVVPFWSMPENTEHPTQKPEKLIAKIVLASSNPGDVVLDPFLGSGTTAVVAKKLGRDYIGIDMDDYFCCLAEKRLELADENKKIQGYENGVFWDRNAKNR